MNTRFHTTCLLAAALGALLLTSTVSAGLPARAQEKLRTQGGARAEARQPRQQQEARHEAAPKENPVAHAGAPNVGGSGRNVWNNRGNVGTPAANGGNTSNGGKSWNGGAWNIGNNHGGNYANHAYRPPHVVATLPPGYRHYTWHGSPYYQHAGLWYRPYGASYVVTGAPYGLFVSYLPGYYSSFWFGSTRYYYADNTYYLYEPVQHGYVVTHSPYTSEENTGEQQQGNAQDEDLYIYPAQGQSEQQQADDRYACHRWGAQQSGYDPIDSDYDADRRADYLRAMTACLTGRGYSVR